MRFLVISISSLVLASSGISCSSTSGSGIGTGSVQAFVVPEDTVTDGLHPGTELENIKDGWIVKYERFLVNVGNFRAHRSADPNDSVSEAKVYVVDLMKVPESGFVIAKVDDISAERWDKVGYDIPNASSSSLKAEATSQEDYDFMVKNGYSIYFEATMTKKDGQSCDPKEPSKCVAEEKVSFKWGLAAGTSYDDCAPEEGDSGFAVPTGGSAQVKPTIHGDHWYFSNIPHGSAEITERRAQWIANADANHDGETTLDELKSQKASDVFPASLYDLSGGLVPISTAYDYLDAEVRSIGHFQGDGDCETRAVLK